MRERVSQGNDQVAGEQSDCLEMEMMIRNTLKSVSTKS